MSHEARAADQYWIAGVTAPTGPELAGLRAPAMAFDSARGRVVLNGGGDLYGLVDGTWEYDGTSWMAGPVSPPALGPRYFHAMAFDSSRSVTVLFGGYSNASAKNDTWEYDGASWTLGPAAPGGLGPRAGHAMAFDSLRSRTVMFGGNNTNQTWEYDGVGWSAGAAAPPGLMPRSGPSLAFDSIRNVMVLFGGDSTASTWEYNGLAWTLGPVAPAALKSRGSAVMGFDSVRGRTVLFGGSGSSFYNDTWEYDGSAWVAGPAAPADLVARYLMGGAFDAAHGRMVVFGGDSASNFPLDDTWTYDGVAWTPGPKAPKVLVARQGHSMVYDASRAKVVLFGGNRDHPWTGSNGVRSDTWEYDGVTWEQGAGAPATLTPRSDAALAFDAARGRTVLIGGSSFGEPVFRAWEYDGSSWTAGPDAYPMPPRYGHAMAFDAALGKTILFGGNYLYGGPQLDDTWEYDASSWSQGPVAPSGLTPRAEHAMAYDAGRGRVVLFGGYASSGIPQETWEYDGASWVQGPSAPPALAGRAEHAMVYDAGRGRVLLFGGVASGDYKNDCWTYDGSGWLPGAEPVSGLYARSGHGMAYDEGRSRTVLFGGATTYPLVLGDTWELVNCPAITLSPANVGPGVFGTPYSQTITAGGGALPYTFTIAAGSLPPGLALSPSGVLSGTPLKPGTYGFSVEAADVHDCRGSHSYLLAIGCAVIDVSPALLPAASVGVAYSAQMAASGGQGPYTFGLTSGALPPGLSLSAAGYLSGVPGYGGIWVFTVSAVDVFGCSGSRAYLLAVGCGAIDLTPSSLPGGTVGQNYAQLLGAQGGTAPYMFAIVSGALPPGLTLSGGGLLSGVPTTGGAYGFTVRATDAAGCAGTRPYSVLVRQAADHVAGEGLGPPNPNRVRVFTGQGTSTSVDFLAYGANAWGVNVGAGRIEGGAFEAMLTGPGPGEKLGPQMRGFRRDGTAISKVNFFAYGTQRSGLNVASAELDGDGYDEMVTGPGPGLVFGPHVRAFNFDGEVVTAIAKVSFYATMTLRYGVNVAGASIDADGYGEILTGAGPSPAFAPEVRGFDYDAVAVKAIAKVQFVAFGAAQYGVNVAGGDADGDGYAEMACAPGPGAALPARFLGFNYDGVVVGALKGFDLTAYGTLYGGRAGFGDVEPDGREELVTGAGRDPVADATIERFAYDGVVLAELPGSFVAFGLSTYGVNVIGGDLGL